jgi:hypothetical protein
MKTLGACLVCFCVLALASCRHNIVPIWEIDLVAPPQEDIAGEVGQVVAELGFHVNSFPNNDVYVAGYGEARWLAIWEWAPRKSTLIVLSKIKKNDLYQISFSDDETGGFALIGEPCTKYLEHRTRLAFIERTISRG